MSILNIPYPATLSSEFTLSPATLEDIDDMITCFQAAFDTEAERFWWSPDPETMRPFHRANMEKNMPKTNWRYLKLTQNLSGKLVAWASWVLPKSLGDRGRVLVNSSKEEVPVAAGSEVAKIDDNGKETQRDDRLTVEEKVRKAVSQMNIPQGSSAEGLIHAIVKEELLQEKYNISEMICKLPALPVQDVDFKICCRGARLTAKSTNSIVHQP